MGKKIRSICDQLYFWFNSLDEIQILNRLYYIYFFFHELGAPQPGRFMNGKKSNLFSHPNFLYFLIVVWNKIIIYISFEKIDTHETVFIDKVLDFKRKKRSS